MIKGPYLTNDTVGFRVTGIAEWDIKNKTKNDFSRVDLYISALNLSELNSSQFKIEELTSTPFKPHIDPNSIHKKMPNGHDYSNTL